MTDIVEYLMMRRADGALFNPSGPTAADTIVTLRAEIERLRAALNDIRDHSLELYATGVATAALAEEKKDD